MSVETLPKKKVKLELVGLDGNAFSLMGAFKQQARREKWSREEIKSVIDECMTGDYDHLLCTLMEVTESPEAPREDDEREAEEDEDEDEDADEDEDEDDEE